MTDFIDVIGEGFTEANREGVLLRWCVGVGDVVDSGAPLCEIETDKATLETPSPKRAIVRELLAAAGDKVTAGRAIARLEPTDREPTTPHPPPSPLVRETMPSVTDLERCRFCTAKLGGGDRACPRCGAPT